MRGAFALLSLLAGGAAQARFAPALDVPYRLVRVQEHHDDRDGVRRFESERRIVFTRRGDGYLARMTLIATQDSRSGSDYAMLATALNGRAIDVELDRGGHLLRINDLDAIWARLRAAIGTAATRDDLRLTLWRVHDAATTAQRVQVVAGVLSMVLAPDDTGRRPGTRTVTLPPVGAVQPPLPMNGTETVRVSGRRVSVTVSAAGKDGGTAISLARSSVVDRRSGLVTQQHDDQRVDAGVVGERHVNRDVTRLTFFPAVS